MLITLPGKQVEITNAVAEAVYLVFGSVERAAEALEVSDKAIYKTLAAGSVETRKIAEKWEAATQAAGCKIPREEFIGWSTFRGPERHDPEGRKRRDPKSRALRPLPPAQPAGRGADALSPQAKRRSRTSSRWTADFADAA